MAHLMLSAYINALPYRLRPHRTPRMALHCAQDEKSHVPVTAPASNRKTAMQ